MVGFRMSFRKPAHKLHKILLTCLCIQSTHGRFLFGNKEMKFYTVLSRMYHKRSLRVVTYNI